MKRRLVWVLMACLVFSGCSALGELFHDAGTMFGVEVEGGPTMEAPPEPDYELEEALRGQIGLVRAVLVRVSAEGVAAHNRVVAEAERCAGLMVAYHGEPVKPIPVEALEPDGPDGQIQVEELVAAAEKARDKAADQLGDHREDEKEWEDAAAAKLQAPSRKRFSISSPYIMLFGAGGLVATLGGLALTLRKTLRQVALYKGTLGRVFLGVREWLGAPPDKVAKGTPQKGLLDTLSGKMHQPDKDMIEDLYKKTQATG